MVDSEFLAQTTHFLSLVDDAQIAPKRPDKRLPSVMRSPARLGVNLQPVLIVPIKKPEHNWLLLPEARLHRNDVRKPSCLATSLSWLNTWFFHGHGVMLDSLGSHLSS
jgi:hypothetical protein